MAKDWTVTSRNNNGTPNGPVVRGDVDQALTEANGRSPAHNRDIKITAPGGSSYSRGK